MRRAAPSKPRAGLNLRKLARFDDDQRFGFRLRQKRREEFRDRVRRGADAHDAPAAGHRKRRGFRIQPAGILDQRRAVHLGDAEWIAQVGNDGAMTFSARSRTSPWSGP